MIRGTTPTVTLTVPNVDLSDMKHVYITFSQLGRELFTKTEESDEVQLSDSTAKVKLTEKETLRMKCAPLYVQIRYSSELGAKGATEKAICEDVTDVLHEGEIE